MYICYFLENFDFHEILGDSMKRGPLLEFWVENIEKFRIYLNILKICVLKVCVPCNEFPKVDNTNFKNLS